MPWTNQNGGDDAGPERPRGPWGQNASGGGNSRPPSSVSDFLKQAAEGLRRLVPDGPFTTRSLGLIALVFLGLWIASGVYFVRPDEEGVVLRFGAVSAISDSGMRYHLPWPIEVAYTPKVKNENKIIIGYQPADSSEENSQTSDVVEESHMLTGDENIVDINFTVYWKIKDAPAFLFNVPQPQETTIKAVAESAMREVVGETQIERIQTSEREQIQLRVRDLIQKTHDS